MNSIMRDKVLGQHTVGLPWNNDHLLRMAAVGSQGQEVIMDRYTEYLRFAPQVKKTGK